MNVEGYDPQASVGDPALSGMPPTSEGAQDRPAEALQPTEPTQALLPFVAPESLVGPPFGTIVADPPWAFSNKATRAAATDHYKTLPVHAIQSFTIYGTPIHKLATDAAHLYLWVPDALLRDGLSVVDAWGFDLKQILTWAKTDSKTGKLQMGLGNYFRHASEHCLFATRGKCKARVNDLMDLFWAPRTEHSRKPELLQDMAEKLSPGPYLEIFGRRLRPGWFVFGDQVPVAAAQPTAPELPAPATPFS